LAYHGGIVDYFGPNICGRFAFSRGAKMNIKRTSIPGTLYSYGKLPEQGDITCILMYDSASANVQARFQDSAGNVSKIVLPSFPIADIKAVVDSVWTGGSLFTMSGNAQFTIREYTIIWPVSSEPLPTQAFPISSWVVGGSDCRTMSDNALQLKSGGLLFCWYSNITYVDRHADYGLAYRSPAGIWTTYPLRLESDGLGGGIVMSKMTLSQHPATGEILITIFRDSYHAGHAVWYKETVNGLQWLATDLRFLNDDRDGVNTRDGEFAEAVAIHDPYRNGILLAYENWDWKFTPLVRAMKITIASIAADRSKTFIPCLVGPDEWTIEGRGLALWTQGSQIDLAYFTMPTDGNTEVWLNNYNGAWGTPTFLTTARQFTTAAASAAIIWDEIAYAANKRQIAVQHKDAVTGALSIEIIDMDVPILLPPVVEPPIPPPPPVQVAGVSISPATGSYSGKMGTSIDVNFTVKNTGNGLDGFNVAASDTKKWTPNLTFGTSVLAPGEGSYVRAGISIPTRIPNNTVDTLTIKATSAFDSKVGASAVYKVKATKR
jgi:hypothetical protein